MDMGSISAAIGGLKTASDIAKTMVNIRDAAALQAKTIELQQVILAAQSSGIAAQSEQFTLLARIRELEEKVANVEAWAAEKERYELNEVRDGLFTYVLKREKQAGEPLHQLCANCFDTHNKKSILQAETEAVGRAKVLVCNHCDSVIYLTGARREEHGRGRPRRR